MKFIAWNCQGTNNVSSLVQPFVVWLCKSFSHMFLFLSETKSTVDHIVSLTRCCNPTFVCGCDVVGTSGGFVVLGWCPYDVFCAFC